ncbi:hypothetical protein [Plantactinospora sp. B24E8]|uniref:DUF6928 family protein n=1 Tax=Plantactinospora sp. B24E8 TaxID=3153567 RepID=UPI00325CDE4A
MGAKTAMLAYADGDIRPALRNPTPCTVDEAEGLVRRVHPEHQVAPETGSTLYEGTYPPEEVGYATVLAGAELLCDRRLTSHRPSELPERLRAFGAGRRILLHGMHSMVDALSFAVWEDGRLVRSLSLSPDDGIVENIGEPYDFELPYWAGDHPVRPAPGWPRQGPYPLPFHPLDLGEAALRALFGFVLEGRPEPDDVDPDGVPLHGFRLTDPSGAEQAERARLQDLVQLMRPPQRLRMGPDGRWHEIGG